MRFETISAEHFIEFHHSFQGDNPETFKVCARCGGACEFTKIGTLMPGEREYMAWMSGMGVPEFSEKFLDTLIMSDGMELDVLRLINGCPFLDRGTFECRCRAYKVVLCEIYPIGFQVVNGRVAFEIDDWCPLSDTGRFRKLFKDGIPLLSKLPVPVEWYRYVSLYDDLHFDYEALQACGRDPSKSHTFTLEELLGYQRSGLANEPKERFHPFPEDLVVAHPYDPVTSQAADVRTLDRRAR